MQTTHSPTQHHAVRQNRLTRRRNRRGITLLFVVSMIVLFLLMGTTFVVISNDYLKSARRRGHHGLQRDRGAPLLERAFYELVRGPSLFNTTSPLRGQSLLADLYGYGIKARVRTISAIDSGTGSDTETGGQFLEMTLKSPVAPNFNADRGVPIRSAGLAADEAGFNSLPDFYNGLLATFTTKKGAGATVRIVDYDPTTFTFRIVPVWQNLDSDQKDVFRPGNPFAANAFDDLIDSEIVINSAPFAGTGAGGFDATSTGAQLTDKALLPNRRGESFARLIAEDVGYLSNDNAPNEPWDAADYQNMFLAYGDGSAIPSFYRQYLNGAGADFREFPQAPNRGITVDNDGDGIPDGIWMDIGLPVQTDASGRYIKPLVSYKVIDLDGRLNLNAAGGLADSDTSNMGYVSASDNFLQVGSTTGLPRGQGYGPGDISLRAIFGNEYQTLLQERYRSFDGSENVPGTAGRDNRSAKKLFGYPTDNIGNPTNGPYGTRGRLFASSAMDIHGRFAIGTPEFAYADYRDPNIQDFPNGLPGIDMLASNLNSVTNLMTEIGNSPYEMNFAMSPFGDASDSPFTPQEFERLLRTQDRDAFMLPQRLWKIAPMAFQDPAKRAAVATESWSIPTLPFSQVQIIADMVNSFNILPADIEQQRLLPPEVLLGLKMNVNREFGNGDDDDGDGLIDEPGEINRDFANRDMNGFALRDKQDFAKQLYLLTLLYAERTVMFPVDIDGDGNADANDYRAMIAQWCVNVVDFRDRDSIMTTVEFDKDPTNGWDVDGDIGTDEPESLVVRGCERPELLLTEGIAFHDRRTEDESIGGMAGMGDADFDSRLRPQAAAFIELYNPWTQNRLNQELPPELYGIEQGVNLTLDAVANNGGGSPVWRIAVRRYSEPGQPKQNMLRAIYFGDNWSDVIETDAASNVEVFSPSASQIVNSIQPGMHAVIGSGSLDFANGNEYLTPIGRLDYITKADEGGSMDLDKTRSISLVPASNLVKRNEWNGTSMDPTLAKTAVAIVLDSPRSFNLSDPQFGYPDSADPALSTFIGDGYEYLSPYNRPLDGSTDRNRNDDDIEAIWTNGTSVDFRTVDLQRLADPTQQWDSVYNPYVTIDSMSVNLLGYNGVQNDPSNNNMITTPDPGVALSPVLAGAGFKTDFRAYERGYRVNDTRPADQKRLLWQADSSGRRTPPNTETSAIGDGHKLSFEFVESLGETNDWDADPTVFTQPLAYPWLQWNNRPYVSHLELANVPIVAPDKLTQQFTIDDGTVANPYNSILCPFGHMPNMTNTNMSLFRVLDLLEVPSRFVGTEQYLNGDTSNGGGTYFDIAPFNYLSRYRVPGKINLNTISSPLVWEGLMREYGKDPANGGIDGSLSFGQFQAALGVNTPNSPPDVFKPFQAHRYVPPTYYSAGSDVETGLFRPDSTGTKPLFDFEPMAQMAYNNTDRSPYFRNQMRQRLGNLVTNQSNVFAIWITIGYFEYDPSPAGGYVPVDIDPSNDHFSELGYELGEVKRSRAFYIFDRSVPMGFEPGKNHNVDRGILVKTIIDE